jgi:hypothetical protein
LQSVVLQSGLNTAAGIGIGVQARWWKAAVQINGMNYEFNHFGRTAEQLNVNKLILRILVVSFV